MKIKLVDISKKFKDVTILENINVEFKPGKIYGLVGRNGAGKSVLLKIICGFYNPTSGQVLFNDKCINLEKEFAPSTRALIERPNFLPDATGYQNLHLLASIQGNIGEKEIIDTLEKINLLTEKDKKYSKYSLGMKQKLGIAQVLMEDPEVEILDEPFNGIDDESKEMITKVLLEEKKKGKTIILATHMKEDLNNLCDVVFKIENYTLKEEKEK